MAERKCVDPVNIKSSGGKATCPTRFDAYLAKNCEDCPKIRNGFGNTPILAGGNSKIEKIADQVSRQIREKGISDAARKHNRNFWRTF